ncbi:MAG: TonB-dependent receptor [Novosphingobium sp.]
MKKIRNLSNFLTATAVLAVAQHAHAQTATEPALAPGEIVVTAQKREQNVQRVGIAITALGKDAMAAIGRQDVTALAGQVPSLNVNQYSPTVTIFNIRGVSQNDFTDAQEAPIAFYDDEVYVSSLGAITGMNFDLERVEVLRGPQGTLFGRNATGGLVQFISAKPTKDLQAFATLTGGSFGQFATEGAVSGPLSDNVRGRLSVTTNNSSGYITNVNPNSNGKLGANNFWAIRGQLAADLSPDDKVSLKVQVMRNAHERNAGLYSWAATYPSAHGLGDFAANVPGGNPSTIGATQGQDASGYINTSGSPFIQNFNANPVFDRTFWQATARYEHNFNWGTLTSITDYQHLRKFYFEDSDMSPNTIAQYTTTQRFHQASEELRLSGKTDKLNWVIGAYGLIIHSDNQYTYALPTATAPGNGFGLIQYGGPLDTKSVATFGQVEYAVSPTVSLIGGLRYSYDHKQDDFYDIFNGTKIFQWSTAPADQEALRHKTYRNWSGKAEIDYKPDTNTLFYISVNRGTKSGGFGVLSSGVGYTLDPNSSTYQNGGVLVTKIPFNQEVLTNYEGGFKLTLLDRTTHFNASVFHYDYKNYQAFQNVGTNQIITNNQAYVTGAEFELNTRPVNGLYLGAFMTLLSTKVKGVGLPDGSVVDTKLPQAPKTSIGWNARYEFAAGPGKLAIQTDWKYDGAQFLESFNAPDDWEKARTVGNVRVSYSLQDGKYEVAGFVNNVTDTRYRVYNLDLSGQLGASNQTFARPRSWGVSITAKY